MDPNNSPKAGSLICASVYDNAVGVYFQPFFARSRAEAIRSFRDAATQEGHPFNKHPADFTLFCLATWDEESGSFEPLAAPANLGNALEHIPVDPIPLPGKAGNA